MEYWSELPAIAWIATRDDNVVRGTLAMAARAGQERGHGGSIAWTFAESYVETKIRELSSVERRTFNYGDAIAALLEALRDGRIVARAAEGEGSTVQAEPSWFSKSTRLSDNAREDGFGFLAKYLHLCISSDDVRRLWPAVEEQPEPGPEPEPAPEPVPGERQGKARKRGRPNTARQVLELYRERVVSRSLAETAKTEAGKIAEAWPASGVKRPTDATIARKISVFHNDAQFVLGHLTEASAAVLVAMIDQALSAEPEQA